MPDAIAKDVLPERVGRGQIRLATGIALTVAFALLTPVFLYLLKKSMDERQPGDWPSLLNMALVAGCCLIAAGVFWFLYRRVESIVDDWESWRYFREVAQHDDANRPPLRRYPNIHIIPVFAMMGMVLLSVLLNASIRPAGLTYIEGGWPISIWKRELPLSLDADTGLYRNSYDENQLDMPMYLDHLKCARWSSWAIPVDAIIAALATAAAGFGFNRGIRYAVRWRDSQRQSATTPLKPQQ